jgi:RNA polymerase sigma-70 factor, ECF subfamily
MNASTRMCSTPEGQKPSAAPEPLPRPLDPVPPDHIDVLYRAAWALCGSRHEAEDLVEETFAQVLKRPRLLRSDDNVGYLLRALRNTQITRRRAAMRRPATVPLLETDFKDRVEIAGSVDVRELMSAIAAAPEPYRDAVVAVDIVGLSYLEAARHLRTRAATIASRLHRGRQHIARALGEPVTGSGSAAYSSRPGLRFLPAKAESSRDR